MKSERAAMHGPRTILISGAGIAGPTLAYCLQRVGFVPTLVERAPAPRPGGYMIDFWGVGYDVAERMGLLPVLETDGYRIQEIRLVNARGRRVAGFDARVFRSASNNRFLSIPRGDLARRIYELVEDRVETLFAESITALEETPDGVIVRFAHASPRQFDLVVGADGLHSTVRELVFGGSAGGAGASAGGDGGTARERAPVERFLGYYTAAFTAHDYLPRDADVYVSYTVPGRQVARYALRDGRTAFFLVFASQRMPELEDHDVAARQAQVRRVYAGAGWECDEILDAMARSDDFYFDAVSQVRMPNWSRGRIALVGDAAYCPSLLAGQGSAFAMAGAYLLAHALAAAPADHEAAFAEYQGRFKPFVDAKQRAAVRFGGWFAPRSDLGVWLRNVATSLAGLPLVSDWVVRRSFGDRLELPVAERR
ncbi:MAG TPA: FAD-binding domain [Gemmatimonadaceae bacterium]|nr:FAD-binding domain [Gemmatimonadaceae bacterium]